MSEAKYELSERQATQLENGGQVVVTFKKEGEGFVVDPASDIVVNKTDGTEVKRFTGTTGTATGVMQNILGQALGNVSSKENEDKDKAKNVGLTSLGNSGENIVLDQNYNAMHSDAMKDAESNGLKGGRRRTRRQKGGRRQKSRRQRKHRR